MADGSPEATGHAAAAALVGEAVQTLLSALSEASRAEGEPWRLLTLDEAAQRLQRSPRWLRERVRHREISVVRLDGGALGFTVDDLREFADARRIEAKP